MILKRKLYSEEERYVKYEEDGIREKLQRDSRLRDRVSNYETLSKTSPHYEKKENKIINSLDPYNASGVSDFEIQDRIEGRDWDGKTKMIVDDEEISRKNIDKYRQGYSNILSKDRKIGFTGLGVLSGGTIGSAISNKKIPVKSTAIGSLAGAGLGYGMAALTDKKTRKKGSELGESLAIVRGHGDRTRGSVATNNVLRASIRSGDLDNFPHDRYDNFAVLGTKDKNGNVVRNLGAFNSATDENINLKDIKGLGKKKKIK